MSFKPVTKLSDRSRLIRSINRIIAPHVWESGYVDRHHRDYQALSVGPPYPHVYLYAPKKPLKVRGFVVREIECIGKGWISEDSAGGGMATRTLRYYPIEDLIKIRTVLLKHFKEKEANARPPA